LIGELSSALPAEGRLLRLGAAPDWEISGDFQEAWLSLVASVFDMAIYPTLFVAYLTQIAPWFREGHRGVMVGLFVVVACAALILRAFAWLASLRFGSFSYCRCRLR